MHQLRAVLLMAAMAGAAHAGMRINEFHYDNVGTDVGEFVEVVAETDGRADIQAGTAALVLYNGGDGRLYRQINLKDFTFHGTLADGKDYYSQSVPGMQNGPRDGMALVSQGLTVELLSYEGTFLATDGPAAGLTSIDVGVSESTSALVGSSLQRINFGPGWVLTQGTNTCGAVNSCNTIPSPCALGLALVGLLPLIITPITRLLGRACHRRPVAVRA